MATGAEAAGVTLARVILGIAMAGVFEAFEASVLDEIGPNGDTGGVCFASVPEGVGAADVAEGGGVKVMMGTVEAFGPSSGAVELAETS